MTILKTLLPFLAAAATLAVTFVLPNSQLHPEADHPYFAIVLIAVCLLTGALFLVGYFLKTFQAHYSEKAPFYTGVICFLCILNILTVKTAVLPVLYFPSLDRVFGVLAEDAAFIGKCLLYSLRLQLTGWFGGGPPVF